MLQNLDVDLFLKEYWQKKPFLIRQGFPEHPLPIDGDELAGLALEDDVESRLVFETPMIHPFWQLKQGPFKARDFKKLPETHWTLLVQGVDRLIPEVAELVRAFDFIPQWRFDDVMISYAVKEGSVGPHYDVYDVFLYQASGQRRWLLTTQGCFPDNALKDLPLRVMKDFEVMEEFILEPGDVLYLPPYVGHHGIALTDDCMTYSFGYRSYRVDELWDSLGEHLSKRLAETVLPTDFYQDPSLLSSESPSCIKANQIEKAKSLLLSIIHDDRFISQWFGTFATRLDDVAYQTMPEPLPEKKQPTMARWLKQLNAAQWMTRDIHCRLAYLEKDATLYVNGVIFDTEGVDAPLIALLCNQRQILVEDILMHAHHEESLMLVHLLWCLGLFQFQ
jgi:50S ribosomal protein L16 3-hydroxylase